MVQGEAEKEVGLEVGSKDGHLNALTPAWTPETSPVTSNFPGAALFEHQLTLVAVEHALRPARDLSVGDVVPGSRHDPYPADLHLLNAAPAHLCYVCTANRDAQSNLKHSAVQPVLHVDKLPPLYEITDTVPAPSDDMYDFSAAMQVGGAQPTFLSVEKLLQRVSILRNTPYLYGLPSANRNGVESIRPKTAG